MEFYKNFVNFLKKLCSSILRDRVGTVPFFGSLATRHPPLATRHPPLATFFGGREILAPNSYQENLESPSSFKKSIKTMGNFKDW